MPLGLPSTFSIVAADPGTGAVGCAVQSKYFAVGAVVPWARSGVGAVATQAAGVAAYGPRALDALAGGQTPDGALAAVLADDEGRETRQLGIVTADGRAAAHTGSECLDWAGHVVGDGFACQGNILAGEAVVQEMARAYRETGGTLAERLVASLKAGQAAGGDRRGQQSAALYVERAGFAAETRDRLDRYVDLRVDDHPEPIEELARLVEIDLRWKLLVRASAFHEPGRYEEGVELLREGVERFGDDAVLLYDLACYEALAGRADEAVGHLRRSLAADPQFRESAAADHDFDALRDREDFRALVAS